MIDQLFESPVLTSNLKAIATTLSTDSDIHFYTDGSLQRDSSTIDSMGIGWVVVNRDDIEFSASAVLWPSSSKAEMLTCLTTLLVVPVKVKVTIYTDSAAIIAGFDKLADLMQLSVRKREKIPNFQIWMTIAYIVDRKNLMTTLVKVKAHSGDRFNDRANKLAKAAAFTAPRLHIDYLSILELKLEIICDNLMMKASSRRSIKSLFDVKYFFHLLNLHRNSDLNILTEHQHIN